jgi:CRP/FNR family transcriptional regulator/CRP/FNR family cyclic AMP-dependent transcriptional regulator
MNGTKEVQLKMYLKGVPLFCNLNDGQISVLSRISVITPFKKGRIIVHQKGSGDTFYIVVSGRVKVTLLNEDGREIVLSFLTKGDFFGELAILDNEPRSANVIAVEDTGLFLITRAQFYQLIETHPHILRKVLKEICARLRHADEKIESLAFLDVYGRTVRTLQQLAHNHGIETKGGIEILHAPTHQELSCMVGTSRETVTRIITVLKKNKTLVMYKGRKLILRRYADGLFPQI